VEARTPEVRPREVDWVEGACLMARGDLVRAIGPLDERFFLYGEELDWCYAARRAGWRVVALPDVSVTHYRAQSTDQSASSSLSHFIDTRLAFYQKNHGLPYALAASVVHALSHLRTMGRDRSRSMAKLRGVARWWRRLVPAPGRAGRR
jgi:GT2 family glycosyltransferase